MHHERYLIETRNRAERGKESMKRFLALLPPQILPTILPDEQRDLEEFFLNCDLHFMKGITPYPHPLNTKKNLPTHDALHIAARYQETQGGIFQPHFLKLPARESMSDTEALYEELYPTLIDNDVYTIDAHTNIIPTFTVLQSPRLRGRLRRNITRVTQHNPNHAYLESTKNVQRILSAPPPGTAEGHMQEFEALLKEIFIQILHTTYGNPHPEEVQRIASAMDLLAQSPHHRPTSYVRFAQKAFSQEEKNNTRLLLDEILSLARMKPE